MPLTTGSRLGPYEIVALIGAGGMGEVYRARDTKLRREVALKILPEVFAADPERLARFRREAQVLATLNHPNIAAIYGVEDSGAVHALVLELVEGPTLAGRVRAAPIPVPEVLKIASQIADAMEAAHEKGIVHRDLKPANIKVTPEDRVKVLDFGLAKALADETALDTSMSPTMTAMASRLGVIVGTAAYMSPEQAKGKTVDKRTDIWAFGCVLFEMLTGRQVFAGEDVTDFIVAVMTKEPDWAVLPASTPPRIVELLRRCLKKDPRERLRDIGDARIDIEEALHAPATNVASVALARGATRPRTSLVVASLAAAAVAGAAIAITFVAWRGPREVPSIAPSAPLTRTTIDLPSNAPLAIGSGAAALVVDGNPVSLSPDGRHLVYVGESPSGTMLYLRELGGSSVSPVAGSEGAIHAFFSPDSHWLGFLTNDKVKKVSLDGGTPLTLCDARGPTRATWTRDGTIYFSDDGGARLSRIAAGGGIASPVGPASVGLWLTFSQVLPDGRRALATDQGRGISADYADIRLMSLTGAESKVLIRSGYDARYVPPGFLLFGRGGNLLVVRFDPARGEILGDPQPVVSGASMESFFAQVHAAASDTGLMAYVPGGDRAVGRLAWVDRAGRTEFIPAPALTYGVVDLAPDGQRLAVHVGDVSDYVWVYDLKRGEGRKLAFAENSGWPVWNPDNRTIAFAAWQQSYGQSRILMRAIDGGGPVRELVPPSNGYANSWSPDGRVLGLTLSGGRQELGFFSFGKSLERVPNGGAVQWGPYFSPDSRWIAYSSDATGRTEIYLRSYPISTTIHQISVDGGIEPVWCPCGELFYRKGNRWMSVKIRTQPDLQWDPPQLAFQTDFIDTHGISYDVSPDGKRLLVVKRAEPDVRNRINLVTNWTAALSGR